MINLLMATVGLAVLTGVILTFLTLTTCLIENNKIDGILISDNHWGISQ